MWKNGKTERFGKSKNEQFLLVPKTIGKSEHSIFLKSTIFYANQNIRKIQKLKKWENQKIRKMKKIRNLKRIDNRLKSRWINFLLNQQNSKNERDESFFKIRNTQNKY